MWWRRKSAEESIIQLFLCSQNEIQCTLWSQRFNSTVIKVINTIDQSTRHLKRTEIWTDILMFLCLTWNSCSPDYLITFKLLKLPMSWCECEYFLANVYTPTVLLYLRVWIACRLFLMLRAVSPSLSLSPPSVCLLGPGSYPCTLLMCHSHRQEPLELFCESCDLLCCSSCHLSSHKNHRSVHRYAAQGHCTEGLTAG